MLSENEIIWLAVMISSSVFGLLMTFFIAGGEIKDLAVGTFEIIAIISLLVILLLAFYVAFAVVKTLYGF